MGEGMPFWEKKSRIAITCAKGLPSFLKEELLSMGFPVLSEGLAHIETEGYGTDTMRLNLLLRTAQRVLFLIHEFRARDSEELYRNLFEFPWETYLPEEGYVCLTSTVENPTIRDSRFANVRGKDAIVDRLREKYGRRPDSGPRRDKSVIHLYWRGDRCQLFIDTSGEPLSKRGYRTNPLKAPLQETLAAALILATGWKGETHLINPMCGSGTLAIEGAFIGLGRAPNLLRENFGFMHVKGFDESSWKTLKRRVRAESKDFLRGRIIATDISQQAVEAAKRNAMTAGVERFIEFGVCDFAETPLPAGGGVIIMNPEYGERMGDQEDLKETYRRIGDFFKKRGIGYKGYIFTGNFELAKKIGLRTKRRIPFFNSNIECRLLEYDIYEGSKKPTP